MNSGMIFTSFNSDSVPSYFAVILVQYNPDVAFSRLVLIIFSNSLRQVQNAVHSKDEGGDGQPILIVSNDFLT
jgi:hypothetical protein